jgi:hypothetical protein
MLLNAEHFVFYNHSAHHSLRPFLLYMQAKGLATVKDWSSLPVKAYLEYENSAESQIYFFGQSSALHDCLYHSIYRSRYTVNHDLDELILPVKLNSWGEMMKALPVNASAYLITVTYFPLEQYDSGPYITDEIARHLPPFVKLKRRKDILGPTKRSKYIADCRLAKTVGMHNLYSTVGKNVDTLRVSPSVVLLHHYRCCRFNKKKDVLVSCDNALRFAETVLANYKNTTKNLIKFVE